MKKKTKKRRRKQEPGVCPNCGSESITYGSFEIEGVYYEVTCDDCGCTYKECYELKFEENLMEEDGEDE